MMNCDLNLNEYYKLACYLENHAIKYKSIIDANHDFYKIVVYNNKNQKSWDALICLGSYGYRKGCLEAKGKIVNGTNWSAKNNLTGHLTADDIIMVLKNGEPSKTNCLKQYGIGSTAETTEDILVLLDQFEQMMNDGYCADAEG